MILVSYRLPHDITVGTLTSLASARPFNPTTGTDNNGDGSNTDRPVTNGTLANRYSFRGTAIDDTSLFADLRLGLQQGRAVTLRLEAFNVFNRANILGRNGTYGDAATPLPTFGQASPGLANIDSGSVPGALQFLIANAAAFALCDATFRRMGRERMICPHTVYRVVQARCIYTESAPAGSGMIR